MSYVGIDYGRIGQTNRDKETGIHYGVISQHSILQAWADSSEAEYGDPACPECGGAVVDLSLPESILCMAMGAAEEWPQYSKHGCADYACKHCEHTLDSQDVFGDEPNGYSYSGDGYEMTSCLDNDVMVLRSPFYTFAQFCSPCVPGAGNLDNAMDDGVKTYCVGHDWFEDGVAPYPVYRVETGEAVQP